MKLGAFSISLNVKDINKSKLFYEELGFQVLSGDITKNWLILNNESCVIGLFQGMFEDNIMTFNPGWNQSAENLESFTDIRDIKQKLRASGIDIHSESAATKSGPASFTIEDPDGNPILFDQHR